MLRSKSSYAHRQAQDVRPGGEDELIVNLRNFSVEVAAPHHVPDLIFDHCITSHFLSKVVHTTPLSVVFTSTSETEKASSDLILPLLQRWNVSGFLNFNVLSPPHGAAFEFVQKKMLEDTAALDKAFRKCPGIPNEVFVLSAGFDATPWDRYRNNWELSEPRNNGMAVAIGEPRNNGMAAVAFGLSSAFVSCSILLLGFCYYRSHSRRKEDGEENRSSQESKSKLEKRISSMVSTAEFERSADDEDNSQNEKRDKKKVSRKEMTFEPFESFPVTQLSIDTEDVTSKKEKVAPFEDISFKSLSICNEDVTTKEEEPVPLDYVTITTLSTPSSEDEMLRKAFGDRDDHSSQLT